MRIEPEARGRLSGFVVGDEVRIEFETRAGSLSIKVGKIERLDRSGVTILGAGDTIPVTFEWAAVRVVTRRFPNGERDHEARTS